MFFIVFCHILRDTFEEITYYYSVKELSSQVWQILQFHISLSSIKFTKFWIHVNVWQNQYSIVK